MKRKINIIILLISCFLLLNINTLNSTSHQKKKGQEAEEYEVTVTLKLVQVYVTDKKGNPVMDLEKDDFELYDSGKLKTITDFEKHVLSIPSTKADLQKREAPLPSKPKLNRKFFLFFDFAFNQARGILDSKKAALHFINSSIQPTDEVGVLSYSSTEYLTPHVNLTTNHRKVRETVEGFGVKDILGKAENTERKYWRKIKEINELYELAIREVDVNQEFFEMEKQMKEIEFQMLETERYRFQHEILTFIKTIEDLAKALRYIPGHKHIIFFSSGIPGSIFDGMQAEPIITAWGREFVKGTFGDFVLRTEYETMIKELATSNSTVYPVFAEGVASDMNWDMSYDANSIMQGPFIKTRQLSGISSLQQLAKVTGGKYFGNIKSYKTIMEEIQNITGSYYVLGYYISEKWDGKYQKIKVKVKRKGCRIHAQGGYYNRKPFKEFSKLEKQLHFIGLAIEEKSQFQTPLFFNLNILPFEMKGKTGFVVISKIPQDEVQEISGKKVEIANLIFDEKKNVIKSRIGHKDFTKFPKKDIYYYSLSSLSPGKYESRVVMRNLETGKAAVASSSVNIPEIPDFGIMLNPPLLLVPGKNAYYLEGKVIERKEEEGGPIDLIKVFPCNFSNFTPVIEELAEGTTRLLAVMNCTAYKIAKPEIELLVSLIHQDTGKKLPLNFSILDVVEENGRKIFYLQLQTPELTPGKYKLELAAIETNTQSESYTDLTFMVR